MIITHNNKTIKILGDTHLGRTWSQNVPLHRRGDRERMVKQQFEQELAANGCDYHVHMGDLFDRPVVGLDVIMDTALAYRVAARQQVMTEFIIIRGNHDASRDLLQTTAFQVFEGLLADVDNIHVVSQLYTCPDDKLAFIGWQAVSSTAEIAASLGDSNKIYFAHWDLDLRSDPHNLIPTKELAALGVTHVYNGHIHLPSSFIRDGVQVIGTGSMQPYAHGEDATGDWYMTLSLEQAKLIRPEVIRDKCVRIDLQAGEVFDLQLDCLQVQVRRLDKMAAADIDVTLGDFSLADLYDKVAVDFTLHGTIAEQVKARWNESFKSS